MNTILFVLAIVILFFGVCIVLMNWGCVIASMRNKRRGIDKHHSMAPVVSLILAALAYSIYPRPEKIWMMVIPLLDIANWSLLWLPVVLIREARKKK